ncbi:MAG: hypothetical protein SGBAC_009207 [Bacillariaceae sp.]
MARPIILGTPRELEVVFDEARFAILFGYVKGEVQADAVCADTPTPELCYIILVEFALYLDSDISSSEIENVLSEELLKGNDMVSKLDLGDSFLSANATNITNITPPPVPSASPIDAPSLLPTASPTKSPAVPSGTSVPGNPTVVPTDGPNSPPLLPVAEPTLGDMTPTVIPLDTPTSVPIESSSPSAMPTDVPSTSPSGVASGMPSTIPSTAPSFAPSPLPTALPTVSPSNSPTSMPSATPTVRASDLPTVSPTIVDSSAPSVPSPSTSPSKAPTPKPTPYPSPRPTTPPPTRLVTPPPTSTMAPATDCFCLLGENDPLFPFEIEDIACDESADIVEIGCGSCIGAFSCFGMRENQYNGTMNGTIGENSCLNYGACDNAMVVSIGNHTCLGRHSCNGRNIDAGTDACAANYFNPVGKLITGNSTCNGNYACYSHELTVESDSCSGDWACAGRTKMYVANTSCTAQNACSGEVFTDGGIYQAQQQTSFIGQGSCTCENCCVCMVKVISGRCTTPGECCDVNVPRSKVTGILDNTDEELRQDFGVSDLDQLFLGGQTFLFER